MAERHPNGFLESDRQPIGYRDAAIRIADYDEIYAQEYSQQQLVDQGRRCMDCGLPTCMGGCPIANLIPEWNDLLSRGHWQEALTRLHATNNFPEFTGYTCPAPCEPACVLALDNAPVSIKSIERAIVDKGWKEGWIVPTPPIKRSDFKVAVVGSGPAGLAAAQQLNRVGHRVTVFERDDVIGGLMTYGIPDFKFAKYRVARRVHQLAAEGIEFMPGVNIGADVEMAELCRQFDAVCLAVGAQEPRQIQVRGRDLGGIELAMEYLVQQNRRCAGRPVTKDILATDRHVVVLGGGDTGADCVATANRQGAKSVTQIDINLIRPVERPIDNPWPLPPVTYEQTYAQAEGSCDEYGFETTAFEGSNNTVTAVRWHRVSWRYDARRRRQEKKVIEEDRWTPADLVLIAAGFTGPEVQVFKGQITLDDSGNIATGTDMQTNLEGVFAAGDANMGQSIVVWAIGEGRDVARAIDTYLTGASLLPASLRTSNEPTQWSLETGEQP